jgi:hypothetical protein
VAQHHLPKLRPVFTDPFLRSTLQLSLTLAVLVSLLSIVLCMGPAWLLVRKQFRGQRAFRVILDAADGVLGNHHRISGRHHDRPDRVRAGGNPWLFGRTGGPGVSPTA